MAAVIWLAGVEPLLVSPHSRLPPHLEKVRARVSRVHAALMLLIFVGFFTFMRTFVEVTLPHGPPADDTWAATIAWGWPLILAGLIGVSSIGGVLFGARVLSRRWGLVCPHCAAPLFDQRSIFWAGAPVQETGICPRCRGGVLTR